MSTPTSSNNLNATPNAQPEVAALTQTSDDSGVSKLGAPISKRESSGVPNPTVRPVDFKTIEGSYAGDHRVPARDGVTSALDAIANPPGPRDAHTQAPLSGKQSPTTAPEPTEDTSGVD